MSTQNITTHSAQSSTPPTPPDHTRVLPTYTTSWLGTDAHAVSTTTATLPPSPFSSLQVTQWSLDVASTATIIQGLERAYEKDVAIGQEEIHFQLQAIKKIINLYRGISIPDEVGSVL